MMEKNDKPHVQQTIGTTTAPEYIMGEDWNLYAEWLDQFFIVNYIEEGRKVLVLITVICTKTYAVLHELCDPLLLNALTYGQLWELLKIIFHQKSRYFANV